MTDPTDTGNKPPPAPEPQAQHLVNLAQQLAENSTAPRIRGSVMDSAGHTSEDPRPIDVMVEDLKHWPHLRGTSIAAFHEGVTRASHAELERLLWNVCCQVHSLLEQQASTETSRPAKKKKRHRRITTTTQAVRAISQVTAEILAGEIDPARGRASIYALQTVLVAIKMLGKGETIPQLEASAAASPTLTGNDQPLLVIGEGGIVEDDDVVIELIGKRLLAPVDWQAFCDECGRETHHHAAHDCNLGLISRCETCRQLTIAPWTRTTPQLHHA